MDDVTLFQSVYGNSDQVNCWVASLGLSLRSKSQEIIGKL